MPTPPPSAQAEEGTLTLFSRAPVDAIAIGHVELSSPDAELTALQRMLIEQYPTFETCNVSLADVEEVDFAYAGQGRVVVEAQTPITLDAIGCALGLEPEDGIVGAAGLVAVSEIPGGLRVEIGNLGELGQVDPSLRTLLESHRAPRVLVARVGRGVDAVTMTAVGDSFRGTVEIEVADATRAHALREWYERGVARTPPNEREALEQLLVTVDDRTVRLTGGLSSAAAQSFRANLAEAFRVPSASMLPSIGVGDQVFADKTIAPEALVPGDIVVFSMGGAHDSSYVKRIVAVGGQRVRFVDGDLEIAGVRVVREPVEFDWAQLDAPPPLDQNTVVMREQLGATAYLIVHEPEAKQLGTTSWVTVPDGHVYLLGDNRDKSYDSRQFGPVPVNDIKGRVAYRYLAIGKHGVLPARTGLLVPEPRR